MYLGELNPRISGASSITNVTAGAYSDMPLFLFHLLEYMGVDYELDVDEINRRWEDLASVDLWSADDHQGDLAGRSSRSPRSPRTGQWYFDDAGELRFRRAALDWHQLQNENECFFLRIYGPGDYRWKGADLGVLVTKGRLQTEDPEVTEPSAPDVEPTSPDLISGSQSDAQPVGIESVPLPAGKPRLTARARRLIDAIRGQYAGVPVGAGFVAPTSSVGVKSSY